MVEEFNPLKNSEYVKTETSENAMQRLQDDLAKLDKEPYTTMDPAIVEGMKQNALNAIQRYREENPELNN